jgi:spermidine/putrescine transport system permease protein
MGRENTLPMEIWSRLRRGITPEINAISTLILIFSFALILIWYRLRTRTEAVKESETPLFVSTLEGTPS